MPNKQAQWRDTPWYRAPIVWLGIIITVAVAIGAILTVVVSHNYDHSSDQKQTQKKEGLSELLGMPLHHSDPKSGDGQ